MPGIMASWADSGTINPANLNTDLRPTNPPPTHVQDKIRGIKRSRSPDVTLSVAGEDGEDDGRTRKRGKLTKKSTEYIHTEEFRATSGTPKLATPTPQPKAESVPQASPPAASPSRATPSKGLKALPTQRDHTTDQLNPEGDEYIVRETDEAGEQKVTATGHLRDGREYRCRTFYIPNRGEKLFMLATECARVLVYRDSYLLFNKNRSLHKMIANQTEKDHLINEGILPYSYRSRQIAMVTARSMFRQFGARMIQNGRRVRDDYWEYKARKQGFTEDDLASDKRPTTNKPKETSSETASANANAMNLLAGSEIRYVDNPLQDPLLLPGAGLGIGNIAPNNHMYPMMSSDDMLPRDFGTLRRPRQDVTGTPYQDRTQSSSGAEIVNQAAQAADFNKALRAQGAVRGQLLANEWNREHHSQTPELLQTLPPEDPSTTAPLPPQHPSPQPPMRPHPSMGPGNRSASMMAQQQQHRRSSSSMNHPAFNQQHPYHSQPGVAQSPAHMHQSMPGPLRGATGQAQPSPYPFSNPGAMTNNPGLFQYMQQQQAAQQQNANMWSQGGQQTPTHNPSATPNPQNPHQSPMHGGHSQLPQQFQNQQHTISPHMARSPHPQGQGQHPSHMQAGMHGQHGGMQNHHGGGMPGSSMSGGNMSSPMPAGVGPNMGMGFQNMGAGSMPTNPYAAMNRQMYQQQGAGSPQQFMGSQGGQGPNMGMYGPGGGMGAMNPMQTSSQSQGSQWGGF